MPSALPVFSVDTVDEAKAIQARFCRLQYDGRHTWTNFPVGDVDHMDVVADKIREFFEMLKSREDRKRGDTRFPAND